MIERWKEHERASRLTNDESKWRASFYRCFPHESVVNSVPDRMDTFNRIAQRMAPGFYKKSEMKNVEESFNFSDLDIEKLNKVSYGPNEAEPFDWKVCKHIVYMVELFYRLCLAPYVNTTPTQAVSGNCRCIQKKTS
jgi:hypothetical protein